MKKRSNIKLYVIRKYIKAENVSGALRKEKSTPVHDVYVDEEWKKGEHTQLASAIGFMAQDEEEYDEEE